MGRDNGMGIMIMGIKREIKMEKGSDKKETIKV